MEKLLYSKLETAKLLGISRRTLERMMNDREIPYVQLRGKVMLPVEAVHAWVKNHTINAEAGRWAK